MHVRLEGDNWGENGGGRCFEEGVMSPNALLLAFPPEGGGAVLLGNRAGRCAGHWWCCGGGDGVVVVVEEEGTGLRGRGWRGCIER